MLNKILINSLNITRKFSINNIKHQNETCIYAIASGFQQKCGLAVVRLSGKHSLQILTKLTEKSNYEPRKMYLNNLIHPETKEKIDKSLVVWFKGNNSYKRTN